jgi:hypothetical protein
MVGGKKTARGSAGRSSQKLVSHVRERLKVVNNEKSKMKMKMTMKERLN